MKDTRSVHEPPRELYGIGRAPVRGEFELLHSQIVDGTVGRETGERSTGAAGGGRSGGR